jgi:hypothetical protein
VDVVADAEAAPDVAADAVPAAWAAQVLPARAAIASARAAGTAKHT